MPAERRTLTAVRPVKTERTHEENQERDRSLEARIESARRASEIHKKRTGRALRVTEQDVINEEMYEEEDDDLPTQYQRLNAHLHTTSVNFNKKLHDYIATQHGVRNMFMSQYQNPTFQPYGNSFSPVSAPSQQNHWLNPSMLPPQQFNPSSPQQSVTQQGFRHAPYNVPSRTNSHQRSLSIQLPNANVAADPASQSAPAVTTPQDVNRRFSLPAQAFEQRSQPGQDASSRPALSRGSTIQSPDQSASSQAVSPTSASPNTTPQLHQSETPVSYPYSPTDFPFNAQAMNSNPLSMSMPPESQQFIGSALDPNDPRTAMYMAGSDQIPQPFAPTYSYNPNFSGKMSASLTADNATSMAQTPSSGGIKSESAEMPALTMPTPMSEGFFSNEAFLTPGNGDYNAFFDFQGAGLSQTNEEQGDGSNFVNWD